MVKEKTKKKPGRKPQSEEPKHLVLFNDDVHSFDFVIHTLVEICAHDELQAEQCAWITHYKGKCSIKTGTENELSGLKDLLLTRGLTADIQ